MNRDEFYGSLGMPYEPDPASPATTPRGRAFCDGLCIGMVLSFAFAKRDTEPVWKRACSIVGADADKGLVDFEKHVRGLGWNNQTLFEILSRCISGSNDDG